MTIKETIDVSSTDKMEEDEVDLTSMMSFERSGDPKRDKVRVIRFIHLCMIPGSRVVIQGSPAPADG